MLGICPSFLHPHSIVTSQMIFLKLKKKKGKVSFYQILRAFYLMGRMLW